VTPGLPLSLQPYNPFALVASPRLGLGHFPSLNNHVLNPNLRITKEFSRLSNNDDQNEIQSMLGILIAHKRSHLRQNPR